MVYRRVGTGMAAHEGQLFGIFNQLLDLFTVMGLLLLSASAVILWWRRRAVGVLGAPIPTSRPRFSWALAALIVAFGLPPRHLRAIPERNRARCRSVLGYERGLRRLLWKGREASNKCGRRSTDSFGRLFSHPAGVVVSTCHEVKGEEYDTVIAFGLLRG